MSITLGGLYVILDPDLAGNRSLVEVARAALAGGARLLQLRAKRCEKGALLPTANAIAGLARDVDAAFLINDHADLALACGADGVHVGQNDLPVSFVRSLLGPDAIVGCSAATPEEAISAQRAGASYLGTGAIYATSSKEQTRPTGLEGLRRITSISGLPVFGIGGVTAENVGPVVAAGAAGAAVISAVIGAPDVAAAARRLSRAIDVALRARAAMPGPMSGQ